MGFGAIGDMTKAVYDPNKDGQIALAQLVAAVCSESEADTRVAAEATARNAAVAAVDNKLDNVYTAQPPRAMDSIYHNNSKIRVVVVSFRQSEMGAQGIDEARIGSSSPPTTEVAKTSEDQSGYPPYNCMTFIVPPNYYYTIVSLITPPDIEYWTEYDLF